MRRAIALIIIRVTFYSSLKFGALIPCVKKYFHIYTNINKKFIFQYQVINTDNKLTFLVI